MDNLYSLIEQLSECDQRLFACDCAERVLHIYENEHPDDRRPHVAVEVARRYANGKATTEKLAAARAAASAAAWAAESEWQTEQLMKLLGG